MNTSLDEWEGPQSCDRPLSVPFGGGGGGGGGGGMRGGVEIYGMGGGGGGGVL